MNEEVLAIAAREKVNDLVSFIGRIEEDESELERLIEAVDYWCGESEKVRGLKRLLAESVSNEFYDRRNELDSEFIGTLNKLSEILNGAI